MRIINKKFKVYMVIVIGFVVIVSIALIVSSLVLDYKHKAEITRVITEKAGVITDIDIVDSDLSPFKNESSSRSNIIYKVTYEAEGTLKVAWYRGVKTVNNIHDQSPGPYSGNGFGERWLFE